MAFPFFADCLCVQVKTDNRNFLDFEHLSELGAQRGKCLLRISSNVVKCGLLAVPRKVVQLHVTTDRNLKHLEGVKPGEDILAVNTLNSGLHLPKHGVNDHGLIAGFEIVPLLLGNFVVRGVRPICHFDVRLLGDLVQVLVKKVNDEVHKLGRVLLSETTKSTDPLA